MTQRILRAILLTTMLAILLTAVLIVSTMFRFFSGRTSDEMSSEARAISAALAYVPDDAAYLGSIETAHRLTLVTAKGEVIFDTRAEEATMENHANRPEIMAALQQGVGSGQRYSDTLHEPTRYVALRTAEGDVLRVASTESSLLGVYVNILPILLLVMALVALLSLFIARISAGHIVAPVNDLDLDQPGSPVIYEELTPLLRRMDKQNRQIRAQMHDLEKAHAETDAIINSMREGLILLDKNRLVLSMNESAAEVMGVNAVDCLGRDAMPLLPDESLRLAVTEAMNGVNRDVLLERSERYIHAFASPVQRMGQNKGAVLLLVDVTETYTAEISRREFTANVSHELKTPLTAISGYAEILRDGLVRPEDVGSFADRIHQETSRLIHVLNDIFELARLDERRGIGEQENVNLADVAQEAAARLQSAAENRGLTVSLKGEDIFVQGYRALLVEMCYNLIDNAIRYTPGGGYVNVTTAEKQGRPILCVEDNGIGIASEHHQRVFERFYRVDKSRSKASGGTGLGLAIVKHGALIHGANVELLSALGRGTAVTVRF